VKRTYRVCCFAVGRAFAECSINQLAVAVAAAAVNVTQFFNVSINKKFMPHFLRA